MIVTLQPRLPIMEEATGDWTNDCRIGRQYAEILLDPMIEHGAPCILGRVASSMNTLGGREVGFFQWIAEQLMR